MKARIGITAPLQLAGRGAGTLGLPYFTQRNFDVPAGVTHAVWIASKDAFAPPAPPLMRERVTGGEEVRGQLAEPTSPAPFAAVTVERPAAVTTAWTPERAGKDVASRRRDHPPDAAGGHGAAAVAPDRRRRRRGGDEDGGTGAGGGAARAARRRAGGDRDRRRRRRGPAGRRGPAWRTRTCWRRGCARSTSPAGPTALPALAAAWDLAAAAPRGAVLWIHGPQRWCSRRPTSCASAWSAARTARSSTPTRRSAARTGCSPTWAICPASRPCRATCRAPRISSRSSAASAAARSASSRCGRARRTFIPARSTASRRPTIWRGCGRSTASTRSCTRASGAPPAAADQKEALALAARYHLVTGRQRRRRARQPGGDRRRRGRRIRAQQRPDGSRAGDLGVARAGRGAAAARRCARDGGWSPRDVHEQPDSVGDARGPRSGRHRDRVLAGVAVVRRAPRRLAATMRRRWSRLLLLAVLPARAPVTPRGDRPARAAAVGARARRVRRSAYPFVPPPGERAARVPRARVRVVAVASRHAVPSVGGRPAACSACRWRRRCSSISATRCASRAAPSRWCCCGSGGAAVERQGVYLRAGGELVMIDAPCSGMRMLWAALLLACCLAALFRLRARSSLLAVGAAALLAVAGQRPAHGGAVLGGHQRAAAAGVRARRHRRGRVRDGRGRAVRDRARSRRRGGPRVRAVGVSVYAGRVRAGGGGAARLPRAAARTMPPTPAAPRRRGLRLADASSRAAR